MENKKLLSLLAVLFLALIFGAMGFKDAMAKTCTADGVSGVCEYPSGLISKLLKSCSSSSKVPKGEADCGSGGLCCIPISGATKTTCTADGVSGVCRFSTELIKKCSSSENDKGQADCGSGGICCVPKKKTCTADGTSGECSYSGGLLPGTKCVGAGDKIEKGQMDCDSGGTCCITRVIQTVGCEANGVVGVCRMYCISGSEEKGKEPISGGCSASDVCCIPKGSADKCCIISLESKNYRVSNCKKDMTIGLERECAEIKNVNCDTLVQCKNSPDTTGTGAGATGAGGPATTATFDNPIGFTTVSELLSSVLSKLMGIIAIVAIVFIVIGGIMYILSAGNTTMMTRAKNIWTGAVIGLAIALAAPTFLKEIREILGGGQTGGSAEAWVSNALTIKQIALNILKLLLSLVGILGIVALVIGGGMFLTAYGNERQIDKGKALIKYAIIGIAISIAALIIVREVASLLGAPAG